MRLGRHLLGRRSDPVAKGVFPPFEVQAIEVSHVRRKPLVARRLAPEDADAAYEKKIYEELMERAARGAVRRRRARRSAPLAPLNEKPPSADRWRRRTAPPTYRFSIVPEEIVQVMGDREVRIERWTETMRRLSGSIRVADSVASRTVLEGVLRRQLTRVDALID